MAPFQIVLTLALLTLASAEGQYGSTQRFVYGNIRTSTTYGASKPSNGYNGLRTSVSRTGPRLSSTYNVASTSYAGASYGPYISGYGASTRGYGAPSGGYGASGLSYGAIRGSYGASGLSYGALRGSYGASGSSYGASSSSYGITRGYGAPTTSYGAPISGYGASISGYGVPISGYGAPVSGYGAPVSGYGAPVSGYGAPTSGYGAPVSGYGAPGSGYGGARSSAGLVGVQGGRQGASGYSGPQNTQVLAGGRPQYFLSWEEGPEQYTWAEADQRCRARGMQLISLQTAEKDRYIASLVDQNKIEFIWTSGTRRGAQFVWGYGEPVYGYTNWAQTGGDGRPQPDDREGQENCLAVLNRFYPNDGITWHDIACHHKKHFVCEYY